MTQKPFTIYTGNSKTMYLKAVLGSCTGGPLDLTDCTEIDIALPNADGTFKHFLLSTGGVVITAPAVLGRYNAPISALVSSPLQPGELQNFNVTFTIAGKKFTVPYLEALSVFEST